MLRFTARRGLTIPLGIRGEHNARQIVFSLSLWQEAFGEGRAELLVQRAGDAEAYPAALTVEGSSALWTITAADVDKPGFGKVQLNYYVGDALVKSEAWTTSTAADPMPIQGETPPDPAKSWVDAVMAVAHDVHEVNEHPPIPGEDGFWHIWNADTDAYEASENPLPKVVGRVLTVKLTVTTTGRALYMSHTAQEVYDHVQAGGSADMELVLADDFMYQPGIYLRLFLVQPQVAYFEALFASTAFVVAIGNTKEEVQYEKASVMGPQGEPGPAGEDGHTPVKGVDYWTAEDKQNIVDDVLAALPVAEGVGF